MNDNFSLKALHIDSMTCSGCESKIEMQLSKLDGVQSVSSNYKENIVYVKYDNNIISTNDLIKKLESIDYHVVEVESINEEKDINGKLDKNKKDSKTDYFHIILILAAIVGIYILIDKTVGVNFIPDIDKKMSYSILFVIGLLTSLHCISMCGGINISVCMNFNKTDGKSKNLGVSFLYNLARVVSYTIIGGVIGGIGSVVGFSGTAKGFVAIVSGVFMILLGIKLLNIIPSFRKINLKMPKFFGTHIYKNLEKKGPFYIGLLNGFMPCGPLQTMQLYALGTGSILVGALSMLFFSLGTFPLMFGLGTLTSVLNKKFSHKMIKLSGILVVIMGIIMLNRGMSLSGYNMNFAFLDNLKFSNSNSETNLNIAQINGDIQEVTMEMEEGQYYPIIVQKGVPVKWNIKANETQLNGCNEAIVIPTYDVEKDLDVGDNLVEFTPESTGDITYTCWMGMITSYIRIVDDIENVDTKEIMTSNNKSNVSDGSCPCCQ